MDKQVIVTTSWDDGHKLDLRLAEILKKYGIRGTFYISPKNREFRKEDLLSDEEIIKQSKDFEIGAHTTTHPRLTKISEKQAFQEIVGSKKYLENLIKMEVKSFCYPGGNYNDKIKELVKEAGFTGARTIKRFCFSYPSDPLIFGTTIQAYNNILDIPKILKFSKFNLLEFYKNLYWEHRAKRMFDHVMEIGGVYHLWGHSWEIEKIHYWNSLENLLSYVGNKENIKYLTNSEVINESWR
ncbi:MAG: polysaccharide deacetylase family protein [Candidatus Humimicrobiaceae bacterium]